MIKFDVSCWKHEGGFRTQNNMPCRAVSLLFFAALGKSSCKDPKVIIMVIDDIGADTIVTRRHVNGPTTGRACGSARPRPNSA